MVVIDPKGTCLRNAFNFSKQSLYHKFDKDNFDPKRFKDDYPKLSPKLNKLIQNIKDLDKADMHNHGKVFKHIIYSDIKNSSAGAKMIAAGLTSEGFNNIYNKSFQIDKKLLDDNIYSNFALLCSVAIYDKPFSITLRKNIMNIFNDRTKNINGKQIRILILDQGYKEGLDAFDVKYVHLFEPLISTSDEKQAVGRATRFCGQKGLQFDQTFGWPLHVYRYEIQFNKDQQEKYGVKTAFDMFVKYSGLDMNKLIFSSELETITRYGAVDHDLTFNIHNYGNIENDTSEETTNTYLGYKKIGKNNFSLSSQVPNPLILKEGGGIKGKRKKGMNLHLQKASTKKLNFKQTRNYIFERFQKYTWSKIEFENLCSQTKKVDTEAKEVEDLYKDRIINFTPSQEFVSRYFSNTSPTKGLLLWHSVGTGKTCSAVAIASRGFEQHGYTILWVTRHTLKPDIWKNIFGSVCSLTIQRKIKHGEYVPSGMVKGPLKYLSKNWIMPISYKQFSNMLTGKNKIYQEMVRRNGSEDPLRKTLVIIDEAHKLYSPDLPALERPNINALNSRIQNSYDISKSDSVKLLLMTATPYGNDPMDLMKLFNLMIENKDEKLPEDYEQFSSEFLDKNGMFTSDGSKKYLDKISGYVSYLNRERDARQFAYPVFHNFNVQMTGSTDNSIVKLNNDKITCENDIDKLNDQIKNMKKDQKEEKNTLKERLKTKKDQLRDIKKQITSAKNKSKTSSNQEDVIDNCLKKK